MVFPHRACGVAAGAAPIPVYGWVRGELGASVHVLRAPCFQRRPVPPGLGHSIATLGSRDPRSGRPALPEDQALVPQQVRTRMVLRMRRRHALELLPLDVVTLLAQVGDD